MSRRLLAALVCTVMVLAMFAGCATQQAPTTAPTTAPTVAPGTSASAPAAAEKKEVTINWGANFSGDPANDEFGKWMQTNFKMKVVPVAIDNLDKLKMLAASDTLPDLISGGMSIGDATFNQFKTDGMIRDIPDDMLAKYPLLKKTIDEHPVLNSLKASLGKNYFLPIATDADNPKTAYQMTFYYRADWAQKLGIAVPTTMDEYYNMLKAFTTQDPDGNGQNDTYGISGWLWQVHFITWVDMYSWVKGADGKWIPGFIAPQMLDALKFYNKLYQEKILDPEFANANAKSMFFTDKIGCMNGNGDSYWIWNNIYKSFAGVKHGDKQYTTDEAMAAVQFLPPLKADANSPAQWAPQQDCWGNAISSKTTDEVLDRILEIANWELTPDGRDFMTYGFKDKDWLVKDGKAISILPNNPATGTQKKLWEVYPSIGAFGISEGYLMAGTPWMNSPLPQECYDRMNQFESIAAPAVIKENNVINNLSTPAKDKCSIAPAGACEADFQKLIASPNIDADWDALIKSYLNAQGLQAAIDEVNQVITQQGLDK
jgi:putative aldouronate transport system substrate-binding protein